MIPLKWTKNFSIVFFKINWFFRNTSYYSFIWNCDLYPVAGAYFRVRPSFFLDECRPKSLILFYFTGPSENTGTIHSGLCLYPVAGAFFRESPFFILKGSMVVMVDGRWSVVDKSIVKSVIPSAGKRSEEPPYCLRKPQGSSLIYKSCLEIWKLFCIFAERRT